MRGGLGARALVLGIARVGQEPLSAARTGSPSLVPHVASPARSPIWRRNAPGRTTKKTPAGKRRQSDSARTRKRRGKESKLHTGGFTPVSDWPRQPPPGRITFSIAALSCRPAVRAPRPPARSADTGRRRARRPRLRPGRRRCGGFLWESRRTDGVDRTSDVPRSAIRSQPCWTPGAADLLLPICRLRRGLRIRHQCQASPCRGENDAHIPCRSARSMRNGKSRSPATAFRPRCAALRGHAIGTAHAIRRLSAPRPGRYAARLVCPGPS